jgi:hypothetical protein
MSAPGIAKVAAPATKPNAMRTFVTLRIIVSLFRSNNTESPFWFIRKSFACDEYFFRLANFTPERSLRGNMAAGRGVHYPCYGRATFVAILKGIRSSNSARENGRGR